MMKNFLDSPKQLEMLNNKRDRAMRLRLAKRKKNEVLEKLWKRLELDEMADHLEAMLMTRLFEMLDRETSIILVDSNVVSAKAALRVMAASDDRSSLFSKGTTISRRMCITWSLNINIESIDERKAAESEMAEEWIKEVVIENVFQRARENIPSQDSMRRMSLVERDLGQLSINRPDGSMEAMSGMEDDDNTMDTTGVPECWPDGIHLLPQHRPDMGDAGDARDLPVELGRVLMKGRKRKRRRVTYNAKTINTSRRSINVSEDTYYMNNKYIQTSRKYPLNCE